MVGEVNSCCLRNQLLLLVDLLLLLGSMITARVSNVAAQVSIVPGGGCLYNLLLFSKRGSAGGWVGAETRFSAWRRIGGGDKGTLGKGAKHLFSEGKSLGYWHMTCCILLESLKGKCYVNADIYCKVFY